MRTVKALVTYDTENGEILSREKVEVMFTDGEPHPKDRVVCIELAKQGKVGRAIYLSLRTLEDACGLTITRRKDGKAR